MYYTFNKQTWRDPKRPSQRSAAAPISLARTPILAAVILLMGWLPDLAHSSRFSVTLSFSLPLMVSSLVNWVKYTIQYV